MNKTTLILVAALTIIIATFIFSSAYKFPYKREESIVVTGLSEKDFESDLISWNASYTRKSMDLKAAYSLLKEDEKTVKEYLLTNGLKDSELLFSAVDIKRIEDDKYDNDGKYVGKVFGGYALRQNVTTSSKNLNLVENVSRKVTDLIEKGIELNSSAPSYFFSKLSELKIDLLAKASADAKLRAETIAHSAGGGLGTLKKANMGVFQIVGKNANENYENGGTFNTSSRLKTASITVKAEYMIK